jgi:cysteine-rich repeat protein
MSGRARRRGGAVAALAGLLGGCFFKDGGYRETEAAAEATGDTEPTGDAPPGCGDGVLQAGEQCDDGAGNGMFAACKPNCTQNKCGDGLIGPAELCDDGNDNNADGCTIKCEPPRCGDGLYSGSEKCDDGNDVEDDDCTSKCGPPGCGDGIVQPGEACDDGAQNGDGARCSTVCALTYCGDGIRQPTECCDDGNKELMDGCGEVCRCELCGDGKVDAGEQCDDDISCTSQCTYPECGDGIVTAPEQCDDGNVVGGDACSQFCEVSICGDDYQAIGEKCEDGNADDGDGCSSKCVRDALHVFVSSARFTGGDIGGLANADLLCQSLAADAELPGFYRAWLSDDAASPATRFAKSLTLPYIMRTGLVGGPIVVAESWVDLVDGTLKSPIRVTEAGEMLSLDESCEEDEQVAWTGTSRSGGPGDGGDCDGWTSSAAASSALAGRVGVGGPEWSEGCPAVACNQALRLYCVEQVTDAF